MIFKHTFTHYLLLPILGIKYEHHKICGIDEAYLGCHEYTGNENMGEYMFVTYTNWKNADESSKELLRSVSKDLFTNETNGLLTLVFEIPEEYKIDVFYFIKGDYSKINRDYVEKHFPKIMIVDGVEHKHPNYTNRLIFDKGDELRQAWDIEYNVQIPEDAEVWPKPSPDREVLKPIHSNAYDNGNLPAVSLTS